ncbi:MAG: tRNA pseudouridine(38-40) synthase TruA [Planctomycetales bacterium]|nr:tRNA pseudouridine(38-40) synthase TruA [Planctomycetales bacterium]
MSPAEPRGAAAAGPFGCRSTDASTPESPNSGSSTSERSASDADAAVPAAGSGMAAALRCLRLTLAYDGSNYFGWQRQPDQPTVQAAVEAALCQVTGDTRLSVLASSRTDTGVHALGQSAVFTTARWPAAAERLPFALNTKLPRDIVARQAVEVPLGFNPLRESTGKRYRYQIYAARKADPIHAGTHWWVRRPVQLERMQQAATRLVGRHDFTSFQTMGSPRSSTIREVRELRVAAREHMDGLLLTVDIEANGFLYNMVRNIAGTLVQVGVGREKPEWIEDVLRAKDRRVAGQTAPPQGLFLVEVKY